MATDRRAEDMVRQYLKGNLAVNTSVDWRTAATLSSARLNWAHLDTTTNIRGAANWNAAFTLLRRAIRTLRQPEGCVPVVVSSARLNSAMEKLEKLRQQLPAQYESEHAQE